MLPAYLILGEVYSILKDIENTEKHLTKLWNAVWMILCCILNGVRLMLDF